MKFLTFFIAIGVALAVSFSPVSASAQTAHPLYTGMFSNTAVSGYDLVAYFVEGEPVRGSADY